MKNELLMSYPSSYRILTKMRYIKFYRILNMLNTCSFIQPNSDKYYIISLKNQNSGHNMYELILYPYLCASKVYKY